MFNDMYAKDISKKISSVKHDKQRKGLFIGGKPVYGYKMHPKKKNALELFYVVNINLFHFMNNLDFKI